MIRSWIQQAERISMALQDGATIFNTYAALLAVVWKEGWDGACHDSSAVLYMLLSEQGITPTLVVGEVGADAGIFDHSWVEVDGKIYDVAVGFPDEGGHDVGPPVFASLNLDTAEPTELAFGIRSPNGLDEVGRFVADATLEQYSRAQNPQASIWALTPFVGQYCGLSLSSEELRTKYGAVTREIRGQDGCHD